MALATGACGRIELSEPTPRVERLRAVGGLRRNLLTWDEVPGASEYSIYASTDPAFETATIYTSRSWTELYMGGIEDDAVRTVWVTAWVDGKESDPVGVAVQAIPDAPLTPDVTLPGSSFGASITDVGSALSIADLDGDGIREIVAGCAACRGDQGAVLVARSTNGTLDFDDIRELDDLGDDAGLGTAIATLDADGDGDHEIAAGAPLFATPASNGGVTVVYEGTPLGAAAGSTTLYPATTGSMYVGLALAAGDFDRDGFDDLAIGAPLASMSTGRVKIFLGSPGGLVDADEVDGENDLALDPMAYFGSSLASGDFDGDGYDDLLAGAPGAEDGRGRALVFPGGAGGLGDMSGSVAGSAGDFVGGAVSVAGDDDGDGDFVKAIVTRRLAAPPHAELYGGGHVFEPLGWSFTGSTVPLPDIAAALVVRGGDFDGDGYDDFVVGEPSHDPDSAILSEAGRVLVFSGGPDADDSPVLEFEGADGERVGRSLAIGDLDADGRMEIVAGGADSLRVFRGTRHAGPIVEAGTVLHVKRGAYRGPNGAWFDDPLDPDGPHTCTIDWGDGSDVDAGIPCTSDSVMGPHEWTKRGSFLVRLRVSADDGRFGEAVTTVHVR